jgi:outer membrane protein OmpA-like peptidoglycan-associated protein
MARIIFFTSILSCFFQSIFSQNPNNLVLNPGFEEVSKVFPVLPCTFIKRNTSFDKSMPSWTTFEGQTPDIVQWQDGRKNPCVYPNPREGNRMVGIINYLPHDDINMPKDYHEFLQGTLKEPMVVGKEYTFQFFITQPALTANFHLKRVYGKITTAIPVAANNLGFYFLEKQLDITTDMWKYIEDNEIKPHFNIEKIIEIEDGEWIQLTGTFKVDKPYTHFILGNFFTDENTKNNLPAEQKAALADFPTLYYMEEKKRVTYYLIDDFGIYLANEAPDLQPVVSLSKQLETKGIYTFENVNFASGKWDLQPAAFTELDDLTTFLKENPTKRIEIGGHTDSRGTTVSNQQLSENRAKAVYNYLIEKGIDAERLNFKGYGEMKPKMTNETEAGRLENRRVECVIL